jgi:hypothetical protein
MADPKPSNFIPAYEKFGQIGNQPINTNLALNTNFRFILKKVPNVTYFCTSITSPQSTSTPISLDYITAAPLKIPGGRVTTDISIRFIISEDFSNYMEMVKWFRSGMPYRDFTEIVPEALAGPSDAQMLLLSNKKNPIFMINYRNMIPTNLSGFTLSHAESEPSVLTATVQFVYDTYTVTKL